MDFEIQTLIFIALQGTFSKFIIEMATSTRLNFYFFAFQLQNILKQILETNKTLHFRNISESLNIWNKMSSFF